MTKCICTSHLASFFILSYKIIFFHFWKMFHVNVIIKPTSVIHNSDLDLLYNNINANLCNINSELALESVSLIFTGLYFRFRI